MQNKFNAKTQRPKDAKKLFFLLFAPLRLCVLFCLFFSILGAEPVYLTWQNDPTTTMTIQWLTDLSSESDAVEVRKKGTEEWKKLDAAHVRLPRDVPYFIHTLEVTNLEPDTIYSFRLPKESDERFFRTMPKEISQPIRFAVGGDVYPEELEPFEEMAKKVAAKNPRFVLLGGDLCYSVSDRKNRHDDFARWLSFLQAWTRRMLDADGCLIPLLPAIGNHEVIGHFNQTPEQAKFFYALFPTPGPQGYKLMLFGKYMAICILDSNHTHPIAGAQTQWLQDALRKSYSYTHRFCLYHVPAYPSVRYYRTRESSSIRRNWVPLFERYSVHAVFENHDHAYKRTHPLIEERADPRGVLYFGDGSWGAKARIPKKASRTTYLAKTKSRRQFLLVELTKEHRLYQSITAHDRIIDSYTQKVLPPEEF